ncbi:MAG: c-type cytochrome [Deltaproteobacteria bacterium]|nr:c-type cytochrome [Deltaproteobacteria bacterium]
MRKTIVALAGLAMVAGCGGQKSGYGANAGSVAISRDGKLVYAVDTDNDALEVTDSNTLQKVTEVKVGHLPARVVVGADERIYISNRGERTVSVLDRNDNFAEKARLPVGVEPVGLALDATGSKLYVVSATDLDDASHGTLTAFDTASLKQEWMVQVGEEPRGVAVVGDKAYVTAFKKGAITTVDLKQHQVSGGIDLSSPDQHNTQVEPDANPNDMAPEAVVDVTPSPDGTRVYAPHLWALTASITADRTLSGGPSSGSAYGSSGPCQSGGSIVSAGIATVDTTTDTSKVDSLSVCNDPGSSPNPGDPSTGPKDFPPSLMATGTAHVIQGPAAAVVDPSGMWLFVANKNSDNVVVMPTHTRTIGGDDSTTRIVVPLEGGAGADGIALSKDGKTAFVYGQFTHKLYVIRQGVSSTELKVSNAISLAGDTLPADQVEGRKLFFSATNPQMTAQNVGIACASCHLEGREDGHVWHLSDGPRQTPSLAGRKLELTAPYHWAGLFPTLGGFFTETIIGRMGGKGLEPAQQDQLTTFIEAMPVPENPFQGRPDLADAQTRGLQAFVKAGCVGCHAGPAVTDNSLHNVGTLTTADRLEILAGGVEDTTNEPNFPQLQAVNTPSLLGLARTAPYLHDGSLQTIRERLNQAAEPNTNGQGERHGDTSMLSSAEMDDLETYLKSL